MTNKCSFPTWDKVAAAEEATSGKYKSKVVRQKVYANNCDIFKAGGYINQFGNVVNIPIDDPMLDGTKIYREAFDVNDIAAGATETATCTLNADCLAVAKNMLEEGLNPCVMNLADAYIACGFYKRGSSAQEESLCRATTLSRSLFQFFKAKTGKADRYAVEAGVKIKEYAYPMDLNFGGIYSPDVTVFRNGLDHHALLDETYKVGIVSVAALDFNEKHGKNREYQTADGGISTEGVEVLKNKIRTIFRIALSNGHNALVAGAFGCGAFRLPVDKVAALFHEILNEQEFKNKFTKVTFAILDKEGAKGKFAPFYELFK
jgi:uncharacterized protein (TIGR02452 family)